jgi:hypothetical protein
VISFFFFFDFWSFFSCIILISPHRPFPSRYFNTSEPLTIANKRRDPIPGGGYSKSSFYAMPGYPAVGPPCAWNGAKDKKKQKKLEN